jgi:hypothetical protein
VRRYILASLTLTLGLAALPGAALADTITASPSTVNIETDQGGSYSGTFKIFNPSSDGYDFTVYAKPFWVHGEDYDQTFVLEPGKTDASKWFNFGQTKYRAEPGKTIAIPYQIKVPQGTGPGGYYAVVFAETQPPEASGIVAKKRVGIIFYMSVKGPLDERGNVESFRVPWFHSEAPLHTELRLKNSGNVHYQADIEVDVKDIFGNTKAILTSDKTILPGTIRRIELDWDRAPGFGLFRVDGRVKYLGKTDKLPARYTLMFSAGAFVVMFLLVLALAIYAFTGQKRKRKGHVGRGR